VSAIVEAAGARSDGTDGLIAAVRRRFALVVVFALLFGVGLTVLSYHVTPIYRGITVLAPADTEKNGMGSSGLSSALGSIGGFAALAGLGIGGNDFATEEAVAVLKSRHLTEEFIQKNDLLPEFFPKQWDAQAGHWRQGIKKVPTLQKGFKVFDRIRKIERDTKSGLISIRIDWKDPNKAADWANQLTALLNSEMSGRALTEAGASLVYLQKEYADTVDVATRDAISHLIETQVKQQMLAHVTREYALKVVDAAMPADPDDPVRPIKILYLAFGLFFGTMVGIFIALRLHKRERNHNG
jgi:uncharacterized protein involved in exopolysaccharide biosynthesis